MAATITVSAELVTKSAGAKATVLSVVAPPTALSSPIAVIAYS